MYLYPTGSEVPRPLVINYIFKEKEILNANNILKCPINQSYSHTPNELNLILSSPVLVKWHKKKRCNKYNPNQVLLLVDVNTTI